MEKYNEAVDLQYVSNMLINTAILLQKILPSSRCCTAVKNIVLLSSRPTQIWKLWFAVELQYVSNI
jgi:hypothetical protein